MPDALTRKSMRLFATEVAPRLRGGFGATVRARSFPELDAHAGDGAVSAATARPRAAARWRSLERGRGEPLVYLHGFADVHGVAGDLLPFHQRLARGGARDRARASGLRRQRRARRRLRHRRRRLPLSRSCSTRSGSTRFDLVGHCVGGWIAAELAVRHPERVRRLALIGACGLFVPGEPIGDVFMHAQPERGVELTTLAEAAVRRCRRAGRAALLPRRPRRPRGGDAPLSDAALRLLRGLQAALFLQSRAARAALPRRACRPW